MRRLTVFLTVLAMFLGLSGATAAGPAVGPLELPLQACTPITLSDAGWSDPTVGTWDPATLTGVLTVSLTCSIQVTADGVTLDGNGQTVTGSGAGDGVALSGRTGVTIKNLTVRQFANGFSLSGSTNVNLTGNTATGNNRGFRLQSYSTDNTLTGNTATGNSDGIYIYSSSRCVLIDNVASSNTNRGIYIERCGTHTLTNNTANGNAYDGIRLLSSNNNTLTGNSANSNGGYGLRLESAGNNTLSGNTMADNRFNFRLDGTNEFEWTQDLDRTNLVDGKPIVYLKGASDQTINGDSNAGTVYLIMCSNITVGGVTLAKNDNGIFLWQTTGSRIRNVQANGNNWAGIHLRDSSGNTIASNGAGGNQYHGYWIEGSGSNTLTGNSASLNGFYGVLLQGTVGNTLVGNAFSDNAGGVYLDGSSDNLIYNNRFLSNAAQAYVSGGSGNLFNKPLPDGGNYWSNYTGPDANGDGFGDAPYTFAGGQDALPWMKEGGWTDRVPPTTTIDFSGTLGNNGWYRSEVKVTLTATDNDGGSGVDVTEYGFTGTDWNTYFGPFNITSEGPTTVYYRSRDKAGNVEQGGQETVLLDDGFDNYDAAAWADATGLPLYAGRPSVSATNVDGRSAIKLQTVEMPPDKRRGTASAGPFTASPEMVVEAQFKPTAGIDGLAELWLYSGSSYVRIGVWAGSYGAGRTVVAEASDHGVLTTRRAENAFAMNEWQTFRIEGAPASTVVSILASDGATRWSTTFDAPLSRYFGDFRVALAQQLGTPSGASPWTLEAYFDSVRVSKINHISKSATLKIDRTPPDAAAGPIEGAAGNNGWYTTDVTATFTASDAVSQLQDPADAAFSLVASGEGAAVPTGSRDIYDQAGNHTVVGPLSFKIDKTPPTLAGLPTTSPSAAGWYSDDVTIHWAADDAISGIDPATLPADSIIEGEGTDLGAGPVTVYDVAGWSAEASVSGIKIDRTPPTLELGRPEQTPNAAGWYKTDVTIPFAVSDALSGPDPNGPQSPLTVSGEGAAVVGTVTAADRAGNTATATSPALKIDKTAPLITASATTPAGEYVAGSWTNLAVTVAFQCSDATSGVASVPGETSVSGEGRDQAVTGKCVDAAGNEASVTFAPINIDLTPPTIVAGATTPLGTYAAGTWTNQDVTVAFLCADALAGIYSYPADVTVSQEMENQSVLGTCSDRAGNTASATFAGIYIDKTKPTIHGARTPLANAFGWNNCDVTVTFAAEDDRSGLAEVTGPVTLTLEGAGQAVTGTAKDVAGNVASATVGDINIDLTPPTLGAAATTSPNAAGWYSDDVTIQWVATDALAGVDPATVPADSTITGEGMDLGAGPASVADKAGNEASATLAGVKIDRTPPAITIGAPAAEQGSILVPGTIQYQSSDGLSGLAGQWGWLNDGSGVASVTSGYRPAAGVYVLTVDAVDVAGNRGSVARSFAAADPSGNSAAGSGSFISPPGAYPANPAYSGKAAFTFTCKYQKHDTVPSGRWTFQLEVGDLSFASTGYEWLAVRGARAQFRGTGTLSDGGDYGFMVTAIDGKLSGDGVDRLRVRIWQRSSGALVYDNQPGAVFLAAPTTELSSGRIQIKP